jgi:hypothetical protein
MPAMPTNRQSITDSVNMSNTSIGTSRSATDSSKKSDTSGDQNASNVPNSEYKGDYYILEPGINNLPRTHSQSDDTRVKTVEDRTSQSLSRTNDGCPDYLQLIPDSEDAPVTVITIPKTKLTSHVSQSPAPSSDYETIPDDAIDYLEPLPKHCPDYLEILPGIRTGPEITSTKAQIAQNNRLAYLGMLPNTEPKSKLKRSNAQPNITLSPKPKIVPKRKCSPENRPAKVSPAPTQGDAKSQSDMKETSPIPSTAGEDVFLDTRL